MLHHQFLLQEDTAFVHFANLNALSIAVSWKLGDTQMSDELWEKVVDVIENIAIADFKKIFMLAGKSGLALLGYDLVQIIFARGKIDPTAVDGTAVIFAGY